MRLTDSIDKRTISSLTPEQKRTSMVASEEQDSAVKLCQVEQCWKLRTPFIEAFDLDRHDDSRDAARVLLKWLIYPVDCDKFLK